MPEIPDDLRSLLEHVLPGADFGRAAVLGEGWNAVAWRIPSASVDRVVRIPKNDYAQVEIERQTCLAPRLAEAGIPIPFGWRLVRDHEGRTAAGIYDYVDGAHSPRSGRRASTVLAPQLADLLGRLHRMPGSAALDCGGEVFNTWPGFYSGLIEDAAGTLGPATWSWVHRLGRELAGAAGTAPASVLVHGDLAPWHLICDEELRIRAVLDFLGPRVADPALDFARLVQHWSVDFAETVLGSYVGDVDANFRRRMVIYAQLEPLNTMRVASERGLPEWVAWGRRKLAASAAADTRAGSRSLR